LVLAGLGLLLYHKVLVVLLAVGIGWLVVFCLYSKV
jgi:hypothetical protein